MAATGPARRHDADDVGHARVRRVGFLAGRCGAGAQGRPGPALARLTAAQLAWTCCALVAPNSTLVTTGLVSGNTIASAAAVVSSLPARLASSLSRRNSRRDPRIGQRPRGASRCGTGPVLAGEHTAGQAERGDHTGTGRLQHPCHGRILDPGAAHQAVGQLNRARRRHATFGRRLHCLPGQVSSPVHQTPRTGPAGGNQRAHSTDKAGDRQTLRRRVRVDHIDIIETHPPQGCIQLRRSALPRPELPPQLVSHDRFIPAYPRTAEQLPEHHLRVPGPDRRRTRLVVIAGIIEKADALLAGCPHDGHPRGRRHPLQRAPRTQRQRRHRHPRSPQRPRTQHACHAASPRRPPPHGGGPAPAISQTMISTSAVAEVTQL